MKTWLLSTALVVAAHVADSRTSVGRYETNPVLGRGSFGSRQLVIKSGIVGSSVVAEWLLVRKHRALARPFTYANFAATGVVARQAYKNTEVQK